MINAPSGPMAFSHWHPSSTAHAPEGTGRASGSTVGDVLRAAAARAPDRAALVFGDRWWTYGDLLAGATDGARALLASFIPGDVVAVWAEDCPQWVALEFAAGLAGLTLVPVNPAAGADEVAYVLAHSGARGIFIGADGPGFSRSSILRSVAGSLPFLRFVISLSEWEALCAIGSLDLPPGLDGEAETGRGLPAVDPGSPAMILYTAGTTGRPKAALLTHQGLTGNAAAAARVFGGQDGDTVVSSLPLSHVTGCGLMTLGIAQLTGTHVLLPGSDAAPLVDVAERHRCALLCTDPAMLGRLLADPSLPARNLRSLRAIVAGGAPLPPEVAHEAETAFDVPVLTGLFQTESACVITATSPDDPLVSRLGSTGRPLPGTEVKITDLRTGHTLPCGEVGEILVRSCGVMRGYLDDPDLTTCVLDSDGWLRTGDLGAMDSRGYCRVVGRVRELIVRGGQDVYPREIESVLRDHPAVAEVAVVGVPDQFWGETLAAIVRLESPDPEDSRGASAEACSEAAGPCPALTLTEYCGGRLASYKIPVRWLFVDSMPRTTNGNIRKFAFSTHFADAVEPDWQSWTEQTPAELAAVFGADPFDFPDPTAGLAALRIPPQEPRSRALEDIGF